MTRRRLLASLAAGAASGALILANTAALRRDTAFEDFGAYRRLWHDLAHGIAHVVECVKQLRGTAPAQVTNCEVAVYGGYTGHMASALVLTQDR